MMKNFKVLLSGGPSSLTDEERTRFTTSLTEKIKHRFGAGYEHFVHEGEFTTLNGEEVAVFRWTMRTAIAE
ncbi:DUF5988 family protein [Streptomyces sp. CA-210063]|uniref:DUF5988 family protein n=1 Tax=Streptomyces sp. CA-210063 TaxID=2801029 RepID=UPI00214C43AE|nr:DUF5988 family protein [Streptomyces sp. CA-210063]UUU36192.1 DUF5988 family protein [Streptomyces sp. CA-210063]